MRRSSIALGPLAVAVLLFGNASIAGAQETRTAFEPEAWSFGGGIALLDYEQGVPTPTIKPLAIVERRIGDGVWLSLGVDASFERTWRRCEDIACGVVPPAGTRFITHRLDLGGQVGARIQIAKGRLATLSLVALAGGTWRKTEINRLDVVDRNDKGTKSTFSGTAYSLAGRIGVAAEREVAEGVFLRMALDCLRVAYAPELPVDLGTGNGGTVTLSLNPAVMVRMAL